MVEQGGAVGRGWHRPILLLTSLSDLLLIKTAAVAIVLPAMPKMIVLLITLWHFELSNGAYLLRVTAISTS